MKILKYITPIIAFAALFSCESSNSHQSADAEGFAIIENNLKEKFGAGAYYTDLTIAYNNSIGNIITTTVTEAPESLVMGQWTASQGNWTQSAEVSLEVPEGYLASDFMFQLNDELSLEKLGELVENSAISLTKEKQIENPSLHMAMIKFPDNGEASQAEYVVMLKPETGGTTFTFSYNINGDLTQMDY